MIFFILLTDKVKLYANIIIWQQKIDFNFSGNYVN